MFVSKYVFMIIIDYGLCNIALHKPAIASSEYPGQYSHAADNAVDGDGNVDASEGKCFSTDHSDWTPWLVIDLLHTYVVDNIKVTSMGRRYAYRAHDFKIELFELNPIECKTTIGQLCLKQDGQFGILETLTCDKEAKGRFLKVSKFVVNSQTDTLNICELEVAGRQVAGNYWFHPPVSLGSGCISPTLHDDTSLLKCAALCTSDQSCDGFYHRTAQETCQLIVRQFHNATEPPRFRNLFFER